MKKTYQIRVNENNEDYIQTNCQGEWRFDTLELANAFFDEICRQQYGAHVSIVVANWNEERELDEEETIEIIKQNNPST